MVHLWDDTAGNPTTRIFHRQARVLSLLLSLGGLEYGRYENQDFPSSSFSALGSRQKQMQTMPYLPGKLPDEPAGC